MKMFVLDNGQLLKEFGFCIYNVKGKYCRGMRMSLLEAYESTEMQLEQKCVQFEDVFRQMEENNSCPSVGFSEQIKDIVAEIENWGLGSFIVLLLYVFPIQ